jgi:hypothetical protein
VALHIVLEAGSIHELIHDGGADAGQPSFVHLNVLGVVARHHPKRVDEALVAEGRHPRHARCLGQKGIWVECRTLIPERDHHEHHLRPVEGALRGPGG